MRQTTFEQTTVGQTTRNQKMTQPGFLCPPPFLFLCENIFMKFYETREILGFQKYLEKNLKTIKSNNFFPIPGNLISSSRESLEGD